MGLPAAKPQSRGLRTTLTVYSSGSKRNLHLQPGLQRRANRSGHPLDARQEPDVLGRSHVLPPGSEVLGYFGV
jgi:hypothetical protein